MRILRKRMPHDKTLLDHVAETLHHEMALRVGLVDRETGTIVLKSTSTDVVHQLKLIRVK